VVFSQISKSNTDSSYKNILRM